MDVAEAEGVVGEEDPTDAQVALGPGEVVRVSGLVGVDEDEVEGPDALDLAEPVHRPADVDVDAVAEVGLLERAARELGALELELERVERRAGAHAAQEAHAAVAAERPDLDGALGAGCTGDHLEVQAVHRADLDRREPGLGAALPHAPQELVLRRVDLLGPARERRVTLTELLHWWGAHDDTSASRS